MLRSLQNSILLPVVLLTALINFPGNAYSGDLNDQSISITCDASEDSRLSISVSAIDLQVESFTENNTSFDLIYIEDEPGIELTDRPVLPFIARSILIPGSGEVSLSIDHIEARLEQGFNPAQARMNQSDSNPGESLISDARVSDVYQGDGDDGFWPAEPVTVGEPAFLRGYRVLNFRVHPVQYNAATGETRFNDRVDFHFTFDNDEQAPGEIESGKTSLYAWRAVRKLVENPPPEPARDELLSASYLYIIPEVNGIVDVMDPLIEWRKRQGHKVQVEYVENAPGRATVSNLIENAYNSATPVEFVALVGDAAGGDFTIPAATNTGDYEYALLEGNDPLPDVAIGRLSCRNLNELENVVNKLVSYESDPYMDDTDWFKQGAVVAGNSVNGLGTVLVARYVRRELYRIGYNEIRSWLHTEQGNIGGNQPFLTDCMEWGISVLHYRAYMNMNSLNQDVILSMANRRGRWPAVLAISCATGEFVNRTSHTECFLRADGGGIGAIGTATTQTHPQYNNIMAGGVWKGIYKDELYAFGWGLNMGKYELWRAYDGLDGAYANFMDWNNLMGDPGTHVWTDIPRAVTVEYPEALAVGSSFLQIHVLDTESENDETDALVCIYKGDELHLTKYTNEAGIAEFAINPEALSEGEMLITVTKHNVYPHLGGLQVGEAANYIGISDWSIDDDEEGESDGDSNGVINPAERIELTLNAFNFGQEALEGELTLELSSHSEWVTVVGDPVVLENAPAPGEFTQVAFVVEIDPSCPDNFTHNLEVEASIADTLFQSMISLNIESPEIDVSGYSFEGNEFNPGDTKYFNIEMANIGRYALSASHAVLSSSSDYIQVLDAEGDYNAINPDDNQNAEGQGFRLQANPMAIPGMVVNLTLAVESASGFHDAAAVSISIGSPEQTDPFGPDEYGYICFDSNDNSWDIAPDYDWIEINPNVENHQFEGEELDINDRRDNQDESVSFVMPFNFQYYGEVFDTLTVCSNGWIAFGEQSEMAAFRNRHIGQALGPNGQICVWWDNLILTDNSAILVYHDEDEGRFIIEWSAMRRLVEGGAGAVETFQIILYDTDFRPTYTGDGVIIFQYKEVTNENRQAHNDTPYCTIGISNLDDTGGLEYSYWGQYVPGASPIESEMAITFTTASEYITGVISGTVFDAASGDPVENAEVKASRGFTVQTDAEGFYQMDVLIGEGYAVTAHADGFNDSTLVGFDVAEDETLTVDFGLLFSEFSVSTVNIEERLSENESMETGISIINSGNGRLEWSVEKSYEEGESGIGRRINSLIVRRVVNDLDLEAVAFAEDMFFVAGQNGQEPNMIYVLDDQGNYIRRFQQPGDSRIGITDLTFGGGYLWGSGEREIFAFNTDGDMISTFVGPYANNRAIAYDSEHDWIWVNQENRAIAAVDLEGERMTNLASYWPQITGMSYWTDDPDGYKLWILENPGQDESVVHKVNTETGDTMFVALLKTDEIGQSGGAFLAEGYDRFGNVLMVMINDYLNRTGDRIDLWQIGTYTGWMSLDVTEGGVNPESQQDLTLTLNTGGLFPAVYEGGLQFSHTARGEQVLINVVLNVYDLDVRPGEIEGPLAFDIASAYPNPFNAATVIKFSLPSSDHIKLAVYDYAGREVALLADRQMNAGNHVTEVNASAWASGIYLARLTSGNQTITTKLVCIK